MRGNTRRGYRLPWLASSMKERIRVPIISEHDPEDIRGWIDIHDKDAIKRLEDGRGLYLSSGVSARTGEVIEVSIVWGDAKVWDDT